MWWLALPVAAAIGLKFIYDVVSDGERQARREWQSKREEVKRTVENHQRSIQKHLSEAQGRYDFCRLVDLHHSSVLVANEAYKLLSDSNESLSAMVKMLEKSKKQIAKLKKEKQKIFKSLNEKKQKSKWLKAPNDHVERVMRFVWLSVQKNGDFANKNQRIERVRELNNEISQHYELRNSIFEDFERVKEQRNDFYLQVRKLNEKTRKLKECIRDHCGNGGKAWYARLENRSQG